jgi:hypothetical protein
MVDLELTIIESKISLTLTSYSGMWVDVKPGKAR